MLKWILSSAAAIVFAASAVQAQDAAPSQSSSPDEAEARSAQAPEIDYVLTEGPDDHVIGSEEAAQTMIVYASVTCSHCAEWFSNEWPAVKTGLIESGKIRFVFRPLPTAPAILSMTGFAIAECAPEYDYFPVIEHQMENQQLLIEQAQAGKGQEAYTKVGKLAGLKDEEAVQACLRDQSNIEAVQLSAARANAAGVTGVPAFFINGEYYKGPQEAKALVDLISEMDAAGVTKLPESALKAVPSKPKMPKADEPKTDETEAPSDEKEGSPDK